MTDSDKLSRRRFFEKGGALAATGAALPYLVPSGLLSMAGCTQTDRLGPNDKIGIGFIGCGRRGGQIRVDGGSGPMPVEEIRVVAVADVNLERAEELAQRE